jgi:hypothetical protein
MNNVSFHTTKNLSIYPLKIRNIVVIILYSFIFTIMINPIEESIFQSKNINILEEMKFLTPLHNSTYIQN